MRSLDLPLVGLIQDGGALAIALEAHHPVRAAVAHQVSLFGVTFFLSLKIFVGDFWNRKFAELVI
jgi:hypothetical protein